MAFACILSVAGWDDLCRVPLRPELLDDSWQEPLPWALRPRAEVGFAIDPLLVEYQ